MIQKLLSGRLWLALSCAAAFLWLVMNSKVELAASLLIIREVFQFYFNKNKGDQK